MECGPREWQTGSVPLSSRHSLHNLGRKRLYCMCLSRTGDLDSFKQIRIRVLVIMDTKVDEVIVGNVASTQYKRNFMFDINSRRKEDIYTTQYRAPPRHTHSRTFREQLTFEHDALRHPMACETLQQCFYTVFIFMFIIVHALFENRMAFGDVRQFTDYAHLLSVGGNNFYHD